MALNLQIDTAVNGAAQSVKDQNGNTSSLTVAADKIGVGTRDPQGKLDVSGNIVLNGNPKTQLSATRDTTVVKGSPIVLDLSPWGGGQLHLGNNINDNRIYLEGFNSDGSGHAAEMLITGRYAQSLPLFSVVATLTRLLGAVQIGGNPNAAFTFEPSDASPNAGYLRFGDHTGWKLHLGRARENSLGSGAQLNTGTTGVLVTIQDNGNIGIGTMTPQEMLDVAGNIAVSGDIRLTNADCAEDFTIGLDSAVEPGTVMVVGDDGALFPNQHAYDKRVAGVVSGAGDFKPGIVLDKQSSDRTRQPIALVGKVFCKVDAQYGAITVGDLLTTSPTPGYAMKVSDPVNAIGAMLGKAMRALTEGQGLIPILIALQ
ncbi:MAG: hypothetical protein FJ147_11295 [Deltaproteobacteria bacterium]|nr:hypothetical protein [Deltaproteobacteria bacterium]